MSEGNTHNRPFCISLRFLKPLFINSQAIANICMYVTSQKANRQTEGGGELKQIYLYLYT